MISLDFEDYPFEPMRAEQSCALCGADGSYLDEVLMDDAGTRMYVCSDTDYCGGRLSDDGAVADEAARSATGEPTS